MKSLQSKFGRSVRRVMFLAAIMGCCTQVANTQETLEEDTWQFVVAPYVLLPSMRGEVFLQGVEIDVNANTNDIFSKLDFGAMLYAEMQNSKWTIAMDFLYMDLSEAGTVPVQRDSRVDMSQLLVEVIGMKRFHDWLEYGIGGRVVNLSAGLFAPEGLFLPEIDAEQGKTWFDPVIAARFTIPSQSKWRFALRTDIAGFGIGSKFSWQIYPTLGYRFANWFQLNAAYRALGINYRTATSSFRYDVVTFGPEVGVLFIF